jgi:transcriptional regulator with XRE-family HTH domain
MFTTLPMTAHRKLFLGSRLKRLRRDRELNQSAMATALGISASYLNHLERNQRPVTVGILLRLAEAFDVDIKAFAAEGGESGGADQLSEIFSDGLLADLGVNRAELIELGDNSPAVAEGVTRLYTALRELQRQPVPEGGANGEGGSGTDPRVLITPETWVRDYIQAQRNHFPELEERAETLSGALGDPLSVAEPLRRRLKEAYGVEARVADPEMLGDATQHFDKQNRTLLLSSLLRSENRTFGLAYQLALLEFAPLIERMVDVALPPGGARRAVLHAAGRSGRQHLQALRRRELSLLAFRRDLPALAPARRVPDPRPDHPPIDRDARRAALFHHQPNGRPADPPRSQR